MSEGKSIGVFGGTFDPIHNTHLKIARTALEAAGLDLVLFVVAARPPHKEGDTYATAEQRLAMVRAAVEREPKLEASDLELKRSGPSYTKETLIELDTAFPNARFWLIMGLDSLVDFPNWREPENIVSQAKLLVVPRPGADKQLPSMLEGHYEMLPSSESELSSTEVRGRISSGKDVHELVPRGVAELIREEGIYRGIAADRPGG